MYYGGYPPYPPPAPEAAPSITPPGTTSEEHSNLFVCGIAPTVSSEELNSVFSPYGIIESAKVLIDYETGASKGFGFVKFKSAEVARLAMRALDGHQLHGKHIQVRLAQQTGVEKRKPGVAGSRFTPYGAPPNPYAHTPYPPYPPYPGMPPYMAPPVAPRPAASTVITDPSNLYVTNLSPEATDDTLKGWFTPHGAVTSAKAIKDPATDKCRGFGFVRMTSGVAAAAAIKALHGTQPEGAARPLLVTHKSTRV
eukprot:TRINITY_DN3193_c0_g1_i1.p1 TRINITY_DN3193_c0_g1~~TRINITY_DN3193_c0_g1_i1.p1  ORF type:complete len:287 (-),score=18.36 TRINITY_DN3193_c0_g1_i1:75-833(-)